MRSAYKRLYIKKYIFLKIRKKQPLNLEKLYLYAYEYKDPKAKDRSLGDNFDTEYKACVDSLYDKEEHLFYRDNKRIPLREKNGSKQFWGRGNGWVFGGLPLIIDNLPFDCPSRNYYVRLFVEMAEAVRAIQCRDGDWRTSLLDPDSYNMPENS